MNDIEQTQWVIHIFEVELAAHKAKKTEMFRIPHKPPAGSLKVLHAPARWGEIRCASQTKIYNLETDEFISNPPFSKN
jgi:hypothetical protein